MALLMLGQIAWNRGDLERATAYLEESVAQLRAVGEPWVAATHLTVVGRIALERGDLERAAACGEESLAFARRTGADDPEGFALGVLADVARQRGDLANAEVLGREQLLVWRRLDAPLYIALALANLAYTAAAAGEGVQAERAAHLLGAADALREQIGAPLRRQWPAETAQAALGEKAWAAAYAAGRALTLEKAIAEALGEAD